MLRSSTTNLKGFTAGDLPPLVVRGGGTGAASARGVPGKDRPAQLLFITTGILGFSTFARQVEHYAALRDDVDVTHIKLHGELWVKVLAKHIPVTRTGWDQHAWRYQHLVALQMKRWFGSKLLLARFDALHLTTQGTVFMPWADPAWSIPYAIHADATGTQECREFRKSLRAYGPFIRSEKKILERAAFVSCMTQWCRDSFVNDYGMPRERVALVRASLKMPPPTPAAALGDVRTGAPPTPAPQRDRLFRLVFVGNDWKRKGGDRLVRWHQSRWKDRAELNVFSGDAPAGLSGLTNVVRHGRVPREKLLTELLPSMDVFVLPTDEDTVVWAAIEAAGMGLPVVASRLAGIPEVVLDGKTGLLCRWDDDAAFIAAIEKLMNDEPLRRSMGGAARAHIAEYFNPDVWYNDLLDRMVRLAAEDDPRRPGARHAGGASQL